MRKIYLFIALFYFLPGKSQVTTWIDEPKKCILGFEAVSVTDPNSRIILRCQKPSLSNEPLYIVDGVVYESSCMNKLNPNDIESITVLKSSESSALYGKDGANGVVIIVTKASKIRKFIFKDFHDGNFVPGATVKFISQKNNKDSIVLAANDNGVVETNKLKPGEDYKLEVSSVGYKNYSVVIKNEFALRTKSILLERKQSFCDEVVVVGYPTRRIGCPGCTLYCTCSGITITCYSDMTETSLSGKSSFNIYPNPVQRNSSLTIKPSSDISSSFLIRIHSLSGAVVYQQKISSNKSNAISVPVKNNWSAGTYIVQLVNENGKPVKQEKIIIQ